MMTLSPISATAETVFLDCVARVQNVATRTKLTGVSNLIGQHEKDFDTAGKAGQLFKTRPHDDVGSVTKAEMIMVYEDQLVPQASRGRVYYDEIMELAAGKCPLCAHRDPSSLDHYLPKTKFPGLAVCPKNLLPACSICNKGKLAKVSSCESKQTLNPYYDNVDKEIWLVAKLNDALPIVVEFSVAKKISPTAMSSMTARRLRHHFAEFKLARLYSSQAVSELADIQLRITNLLDQCGAAEVHAHLAEEAASRTAAAKNSWRAALYRALSTSRWYCSGGCR